MNEATVKPTDLAIWDGVRTPFTKAGTTLANVQADRLGTVATQGVLSRLELEPERIDEVVFGNVSGQMDAANVSRVISLRSGIPQDRIAHTVNRNCASGMEALINAWQILKDRDSRVMIAGGTESMSNVPFVWSRSATKWYTQLARKKSLWSRLGHLAGYRPGFLKPIPGLVLGLKDPVCGLSMGETAENLVDDFGVSREEQDRFALQSHERAIAAFQGRFFEEEIVPVSAEWTGGQDVAHDVGPRKGQSLEALAKLKPYFRPNGGSVTVGNSCPITDGAVAMVVSTAEVAQNSNVAPLGYVRGYAIAGCDPARMGLGPVFATHKLLRQTGMKLADFDLVEINEAFAAQVLSCLIAFKSDEFANEHLGVDTAIGELSEEKLNVNGGAIALGHPVGATGARLVLTLLRTLKRRGLKHGLATLCVGGGQGMALWLEAT